MEKTTQALGAPTSATASPASLAQQMWQVNVVTPTPKGMPSERLKARAELVKNALSTGTY